MRDVRQLRASTQSAFEENASPPVVGSGSRRGASGADTFRYPSDDRIPSSSHSPRGDPECPAQGQTVGRQRTLDGAKTAKGWILKALLDRRGGRAYGSSLEGEELSRESGSATIKGVSCPCLLTVAIPM